MFDHAYAELPSHVADERAELAARLQAQGGDAGADSAEAASPPMRGQRRTGRWTP
jgi:hypothetical protein